MELTVPPGFAEIPPYGPFGEMIGPTYGCVRDGIPIVAVRAQLKHSNRSEIRMHGGMVATLADIALIWGIRQLDPTSGMYVTTQLSVDLIGTVEIDDWVEACVNFVKPGRTVIFAECFIYVGDRVVARANGQFLRIQMNNGASVSNGSGADSNTGRRKSG